MKKIAVTLLVIILLMAGIGIGVYLVRQNQNFREKAAPSSNLTLNASTASPQVGDTFTVSSNIESGTNQVIAVEMHLTFDEAIVEAQGASAGSFLPGAKFIGPSIDNNNGTLSYTVYLDPGSQPVQGQGTVAVFTFKTLAAGNTTIAFTSDTVVGAGNSSEDLGQNVLTGTTPAIINVQGVQVTATPTGSQSTGTPTPTTHGNTATPTSAPGSTATNTPTPTTTGNTSSNTNTPTPTTRAVASNPTTAPTLPDSGIALPTTLGIGLGVLILLGSLLLAL
jgi:hypothetical protein